MAEYECICKYCAFADACPSAYFPPDNMKCADLRDMRRNAENTRTLKERGEEKWKVFYTQLLVVLYYLLWLFAVLFMEYYISFNYVAEQ